MIRCVALILIESTLWLKDMAMIVMTLKTPHQSFKNKQESKYLEYMALMLKLRIVLTLA